MTRCNRFFLCVFVCFACALSAHAVHDGLVLYLPFDVDDGVVTPDYSGHDNHGTVCGAVFTSNGVSGGAYLFDGINDYIQVADTPDFDFNEFTASAWIYMANTNNTLDRAVLGKHKYGDNRHYFWIHDNTWAKTRIGGTMVGSQFGNYRSVTNTYVPFLLQWGMISLVYTGETMKLYVNGNVVDTDSCVDFQGASNPYDLLIGAGEFNYSGMPQRWWNGLIDEVRLYDRALSHDEIMTLYTNNPALDLLPGSICCAIEPDGPRSNGAAWRITSGTETNWMPSGAVITNLPAGSYTVVYREATNWLTPESDTVYVMFGKTQSVSAVYFDARAQTENLVLYFDFNEYDGETITDLSGRGNDGAVYGSRLESNGICGAAYHFDGTNDYIRVADSPDFDFTNFTVSVWAYAFNGMVDLLEPGIIGKHKQSDDIHYWWLHCNSSKDINDMHMTMVGNSYGNYRAVSNDFSTIGERWGMLTFTYDNNIMRLYADGQLAGTQSCYGFDGTQNPYDLLVGAGEFTFSGSGVQRQWCGLIDEVRLYNRALSSAEVLNLYDQSTNCFNDVDLEKPAICGIYPPDGFCTNNAFITMTITVTDNIEVVSVSVNDAAATKINDTTWEYVLNIHGFDNPTFVVVSDAAGNTAEQRVDYIKAKKLNLKGMWNGRWRVRNLNPTRFRYTWQVLDSEEKGSGTVEAYADDFFETSFGRKRVALYANGELQEIAKWNCKPKIKSGPQSGGSSAPDHESRDATDDESGEVSEMLFNWYGISGQTYSAWSSTNLMGTWTPDTNFANVAATGNVMNYVVTNTTADVFYFKLRVSNLATNE